MKSARRRREVYPGEWLPEPVVEANEDEVDDVTLPLMMALERLSPLERAAFILHDVFGVGFEEVAKTIGRDPAATRQLAARARNHVREDRPRFDLPKEKGTRDRRGFLHRIAQRRHDGARLAARGRRVDACRRRRQEAGRDEADARLRGGDEVARGAGTFFAKNHSRFLRFAFINGLPGFVTVEANDTLQTTALDIRDGKIFGIYVMRNPDKLKHVERMLN